MTSINHQEETIGVVEEFRGEYQFLSNFYPSLVTRDGVTYPTVEHFFQASKAADIETHFYIVGLDTPGKAKSVGRSIELRDDWELVKYQTMHIGVTLKFFQNRHLADDLLQTGDMLLLEGNTWGDDIWGVVWDYDAEEWVGRNHLGQMLMDVRNQLRKA